MHCSELNGTSDTDYSLINAVQEISVGQHEKIVSKCGHLFLSKLIMMTQ